MACTQRRAHSRRDAARPQSVRSARSCGSKPAAIKTRVARGRLAGPRCGQRPLVPGLAIAAGCGGAAPTGAARGRTSGGRPARWLPAGRRQPLACDSRMPAAAERRAPIHDDAPLHALSKARRRKDLRRGPGCLESPECRRSAHQVGLPTKSTPSASPECLPTRLAQRLCAGNAEFPVCRGSAGAKRTQHIPRSLARDQRSRLARQRPP